MKKMIILILVILPLILVAQTEWTVIPSGGGDFTTISAALASPSVENGDIITCYESTYAENVTISKEIYLRSRGPNYVSSTILDGSQNPTGTIVTVNANLSNVVIQGFTIQSNTITSGTGVLIQNSDVLLTGNVIRTIKFGIHLNDSMAWYQTPVIENNDVYDTYIGIYCNSPLMPSIENNEIHSNSNSGLYFFEDIINSEETVVIKKNRIYNHSNENAKAIFSHNVDLIIDSNIIFDNFFAFYHGTQTSHSVTITRSTIYNNIYFMNMRYNTLNITNTIVWDNGEFLYDPPPLPPYMPYTINYSCLQYTSVHYNGGNGVVSEEDPLFIDENNHNFGLKWTSTEKSPCINTGDPNSPLDPDGTRTDMGALYHHCDLKTYEFCGPYTLPHCGWTWLCFDVLDIYNPDVTNQVQYLLEKIRNNLHHGEHENTTFYYTSPPTFWYNGDELITSPKGYKIQMIDDDSFEVAGFRCPPDTEFPIYEGEDNWIGYFLKETQQVYDAFGSQHLENIYSIQHQDWSIDNSRGWPDVNYTLSAGDMVIVKCDEDIESFVWQDPSRSRTEPFIVLFPELYTYTEEADYLPIYVELDEIDLPDEIAVFVDNECKGARVVQHTFENICAYITKLQSGSVEIEFAYYGRNARRRFTEYTVFNKITGSPETTAINLKNKQDHYYVSFRSGGDNSSDLPELLTSSNYPNPFNPSTVISYDLPQESKVSISIYNLKGQKVKELIEGSQSAGSFSVEWNGEGEHGKPVSSGIYYYRLTACGKTINRKMLLLK